jgi:hypothetical protein
MVLFFRQMDSIIANTASKKLFSFSVVEIVGELKDLGGKIAESFSHYIFELSADGNHFRKYHTKLSSLVW